MYYKNYPIKYQSVKIPAGGGTCRSPLEYKYFRELDTDPDVVNFTPEPFKIPYQFNSRRANYIPDVLILYRDGRKQLVEVKTLRESADAINIAKADAARKYATSNGMAFKLVIRSVYRSFEGEFDDHITAAKAENTWIKRKLMIPAIIYLLLFTLTCIYGGLQGIILFIVISICICLAFARVMRGR